MTTSSIRTTALMAAVAGMAAGIGQSAVVIPRSYDTVGGSSWRYVSRRSGNNRPMGFTFAAKKHRRKIARASRRYNLRMGA